MKGYPNVMSYTNHSRSFQNNRYVYPVLSRRSKGISVGINLNPDRVCNFDCLYCQVDRDGHKTKEGVDIQHLCLELRETLDLVKTGRLFSIPPFDRIPAELRHLSDIAISGDGEPTTFPDFYRVVEEILKVKRGCLDDIKIVLITNASRLDRQEIHDALGLMYRDNGEVWAKLDAGSPEYYRMVSRTHIPLEVIIRNITSASKLYPLVIQSCFNRIGTTPPSPAEIDSYCNRLREIKESGGKIRLVQIYTIARPPAENDVTPLSKDELNLIACRVQKITGLATETYP